MSLPELPPSFYWTEASCGLVLRCRPLDAVAPHVFTTRRLALASDAAWRRVGEAVGSAHVATLTQAHGGRVVILRRGLPMAASRPEADVLVSNNPEVAVAVRAADCLPLLLGDARTGTVAAAHAGWRGTAAGAARAAVEAMMSEFGVAPGHLVAAIGPGIRPCCYEVGRELPDAFAVAGHARHLIDRWFPSRESSLRLDLQQANRHQLTAAGVPDAQIHDCGLCTAMHLDVLTSYRAEREGAGRIAGVIRSAGGSVRPPGPSPR